MTVAEKLVKARGIESQKQVADAIGVSPATVSMWEHGTRRPKDSYKIKLAKYFRTTVQALFYEDDVI